MDKRVLFFVGAAAVSVVLVPVAPDKFRNVCWVVAIAYVVLAIASALDSWSRNNTVRRPHPSFTSSADRDPVPAGQAGPGEPRP